jgi:hypothetical protein
MSIEIIKKSVVFLSPGVKGRLPDMPRRLLMIVSSARINTTQRRKLCACIMNQLFFAAVKLSHGKVKNPASTILYMQQNARQPVGLPGAVYIVL